MSLISMSTLSGFYVPRSVGQQKTTEMERKTVKTWKKQRGLHPGKNPTLKKEIWEKVGEVCFLLQKKSTRAAAFGI